MKKLHSHQDYLSARKHADSKNGHEHEFLAKGGFSDPKVRGIADSYAATKGIKLDHNLPNHSINPAHSKAIADAYGEMKHEPNHPAVKEAYKAFIGETVDQFHHIMKHSGLSLSRIKPGDENPYKGGSKDLINDIHNNNHMHYYPTDTAFGSGDVHKDHPLLQGTGIMHDGKELLANDAFRIVHDYFGHGKEGHSFGPRGEDNAWKHHKQMYSPLAQKALTAETRGQNSWVNFGPHGEHNRLHPDQTKFAEQKAGLLPSWAEHHSDQEDRNMKKSDTIALLRKAGREDLANRLEKHLSKGQDENGSPIRGSNKRLQQAKVFGKPSDHKIDKKGVAHPKVPDANGARTSPERMKMMNTIKDYAQKKMGANMKIAEGKRDETGKLKAEAGIDKQPFDVFSAKGHKQEKARSAKIAEINAKKPKGEKPIKRFDPKPDHRSGNLETQPSPDAAIHEIAHEALAPKGMNIKEHQTHMDKKWGQSQKDYGHMQQKKTAGEIQPMAAENPLRREMGLPANKTGQKVKDAKKPVEQTVDGSGPRFNRAKDSKGAPTDLMRQSRLLHPENKERIDQLRDGRLKHDPAKGIVEGTSVNAKINARAAKPAGGKLIQMPKRTQEKLAASESARELAKGWSSKFASELKGKRKPTPEESSAAKAQSKKAMDAAFSAVATVKAVAQGPKSPKPAGTIAAPKPKKPEGVK
jgi:hypothetical protein